MTATRAFGLNSGGLAGAETVGYPISTRVEYEGFVTQAFQKLVLPWCPEVGQAWAINAFDELDRAGLGDRLYAYRQKPRHIGAVDESGMSWEEVPFSAGMPLNKPQNHVESLFNERVANGLKACRLWEVAPADPRENEAVRSEIPTLILAGEVDPITPPAWGRATADTLANAAFFEFPGVGHGVFRARRCARDLTRQFLDAPTAPLDARCWEAAQPVRFLIQGSPGSWLTCCVGCPGIANR